MIYGASSFETKQSHRNRVLGFLQVERRPIRDVDKASPTGMERKRVNGWLDGGFPPAAVGRWTMQLVPEPFSGKAAAEVAEQAFKDAAAARLKSVGGEFFFGDWGLAELTFAAVPGVSRFGGMTAKVERK